MCFSTGCWLRERSRCFATWRRELAHGVHGITNRASEFTDWTMSLGIDRLDRRQGARVFLPRERPLNNADHRQLCACLSHGPKGLEIGGNYDHVRPSTFHARPGPRDPLRQPLQGETLRLTDRFLSYVASLRHPRAPGPGPRRPRQTNHILLIACSNLGLRFPEINNAGSYVRSSTLSGVSISISISISRNRRSTPTPVLSAISILRLSLKRRCVSRESRVI